MRWIPRELGPELIKAARHFPALVVSGPRRAGKTLLLQKTFPAASYHLLEDPDVIGRIKADPRGWLDEVKTPAILDEIQNVPQILPYIRSRADRAQRRKGQWLLTGSQDFTLMKGVTESMAGRAAVFQLLPFSLSEIGSWKLTRGMFPEAIANPSQRSVWFRSYVQTYLERDVRSLLAVRDLSTFRRFLSLVASRSGQVLNKTDLSAPLGVSVPTVTQWLSILETTGQILLIPPYFENFGKRIIKAPKLHWVDTGLLCYLLGIQDEPSLARSTFVGAVFESFVASEIVKRQINRGKRRELYYFRDQQGLETDFLFPDKDSLVLAEVKWTKTVTTGLASSMEKLARAIRGRKIRSVLVHRGSDRQPILRAFMPGIEAMPVEKFLT
ncbi:MAG: ATP-binding protein [Pseudomonadota bacterium]